MPVGGVKLGRVRGTAYAPFQEIGFGVISGDFLPLAPAEVGAEVFIIDNLVAVQAPHFCSFCWG